MNDTTVATAQPVSAQTLEHVLGTGDLSKLSTRQRVEYYAHVCSSLGLNPLTRPFRFLALNGQIQLYATRDATDQLRKLNGITLHITDKVLEGELYIVTVCAKDKAGREDEDMGVVTLGQLRGESRANALMKAMTKAKRRVTLSICGLGLTDEAELDTMPGAVVFDAEDEVPVSLAPPAAPAPTLPAASPKPERRTIAVWLDELEKEIAALDTAEALNLLLERPRVREAQEIFRNSARARLEQIIATACDRLMSPWQDLEGDAGIPGREVKP